MFFRYKIPKNNGINLYIVAQTSPKLATGLTDKAAIIHYKPPYKSKTPQNALICSGSFFVFIYCIIIIIADITIHALVIPVDTLLANAKIIVSPYINFSYIFIKFPLLYHFLFQTAQT